MKGYFEIGDIVTIMASGSVYGKKKKISTYKIEATVTGFDTLVSDRRQPNPGIYKNRNAVFVSLEDGSHHRFAADDLLLTNETERARREEEFPDTPPLVLLRKLPETHLVEEDLVAMRGLRGLGRGIFRVHRIIYNRNEAGQWYHLYVVVNIDEAQGNPGFYQLSDKHLRLVMRGPLWKEAAAAKAKNIVEEN